MWPRAERLNGRRFLNVVEFVLNTPLIDITCRSFGYIYRVSKEKIT